jgi:hypothetical protein
MWFLGENDLRLGLYDSETKGCCDGLESFGLNRNQGAESTLAYLISHLTVSEVFEDNSVTFINWDFKAKNNGFANNNNNNIIKVTTAQTS